MKRKPETGKTVFIFLHGDDWRDCLRRWLDAHPQTPRIEKGKGVNKSVTLTITAWKRFCEYYHFPLKQCPSHSRDFSRELDGLHLVRLLL